ncbi:MAG: hypothetical protein AB7U98_11980 [Candidatus Nitrosocosmicus sp.]
MTLRIIVKVTLNINNMNYAQVAASKHHECEIKYHKKKTSFT